MFKLSTLNLVALLSFLFGLGAVIYALVWKISGIRAARRQDALSFRLGTKIFLPFIAGIVLVALSQGLFWLSSQRSNFRTLSLASPQAVLEVRQTKEETFYVDFKEGEIFAPMKIPYLKPTVKVVTQVIIWKPFFSFLGPLHTARVTRLEFTDSQGGTYVFTNSDQAADFAEWIIGVNKYFPMAEVRTVETRPEVLSVGKKYKLFVSQNEAELKAI